MTRPSSENLYFCMKSVKVHFLEKWWVLSKILLRAKYCLCELVGGTQSARPPYSHMRGCACFGTKLSSARNGAIDCWIPKITNIASHYTGSTGHKWHAFSFWLRGAEFETNSLKVSPVDNYQVSTGENVVVRSFQRLSFPVVMLRKLRLLKVPISRCTTQEHHILEWTC